MCDPVQKRHDEVDAGAQYRMQPTKAFDNVLFGLRDDLDGPKDQDNQQQGEDQINGVLL